MTDMKNPLTAEVIINASIQKVWSLWTDPKHIAKWNLPSDKWHTPKAENDLRIGGRLFLRMEAKDGSEGFDYECIYDDIIVNTKIRYTTSDNRKTTTSFTQTEKGVKLMEIFEPETDTPLDMQREFCQSILNNFKTYVEINEAVGIGH